MMSTAAEGGGTVRNNGGGGGRYPFTASQWQELEHQALVYKYMISGMPIPPDLLFTIKRSLDSSTKLILHHQPPHPSIGVGWNCFQMGFGRKIDPEPGRCRRTDGKKWRCSKEAYPDSKYCERHMHRGRNRSRKPVEVNMSTTTPPTAIPMIPSSICTKSPNYPSPNSHPFSSDYYNTTTTTPHLNSSYYRPSSGSGGIQDHFLLESTPYSHSDKDYRKSFGMKEEMDEHRFFSESSGTIKNLSGSSMADSWQLEPLAMNNLNHSKQTSFPEYHHHHQNGYSYQQQQQDQSYYDQFSLKFERKDEPQKVMHHFFDEWPPNDNNNKDSSTTQLSISIPSSAHNFFLTHNDK